MIEALDERGVQLEKLRTKVPNLKIQYAGVVPPGEHQFNVYIPASAPDGDLIA